jgi:type I restriction enzyme M protein
MIYHLAPKGIMAMVLANGSLSSQTSNEGEIRKNILKDDLVDCIVMLPKQLFYNTGIPACIWFIDRDKGGNGKRERKDEVLFIDASEIGKMRDRTHREFTDKDIQKITDIYHNWKKKDGDYEDVKGLCKASTLEEIEKNNWVLTPGRYVGIPELEDDGIPYEEKMTKLVKELKEQMEESKELDEKIKESLEEVGFDMDKI